MNMDDIRHRAGDIANRTLSKLAKKPETRNLFDCLEAVMDSPEMEIFVVFPKGCKLYYTNERAFHRLDGETLSSTTCNRVFGKQFPGLCDSCPNADIPKNGEGVSFEIEDIDGNSFSAKRNTIYLPDGKPATIFVLRDISKEKDMKERLYSLAYIDHLTGVPNRQKLKEDFSALSVSISEGKLSGVIALFDLDHFKEINDTYGHNTGDVVLHRLSEYLLENDAFKGSLYRLGGDEFIIFMSNDAAKFDSAEELKKYYESVLSAALRSYTLPNIELKCTLSIGVAMFPAHGITLSSLLSKADIALYQAKAAGRNQVLFFEDRYHKARKFKDIFIQIQPILLSSGKTFGYELLDKSADNDEDDNTVALSEFNHTLDALGLNDIENKLHYFMSYAKQLLSPTVLRNLPREKFIVQMNIPAKASKVDIQNHIKLHNELRNAGYKLALTGLSSVSPVLELLAVSDYCKFSTTDKNIAKQKALISKNQRVRFIATDVNNIEDYKIAKDAGFQMFQGYYFNDPTEKRKTKEISPLKLNYFRLMQLSSTDDYMDFKEICSIISSDVALSYKLLRILNSAAVGLRHVSSISAAVAYMGEQNLKKWIAVLALRGINDDKPIEIVRMSLIRARFGELLAPCFRTKRNPQQVFMVGLLSLLHIAMDMTKEEMLQDIPISDEIRQSLLTKTGVHSDLLTFYENYEYANWDAVSQFVDEHQLDSTMVSDTYISAVKWYSDLSTG